MRPKRLDSKSGCAVEVTLSVIGGLWKPLILFHLLREKKRFMELTRLMPKTTQRMLTLQLRELEADGIVARHVYPQIPPKVEYELTPFGETLAPVLISLKEWGDSYQARRAKDIGPGEGGNRDAPASLEKDLRGPQCPDVGCVPHEARVELPY